ncbi:MAG: hypothetical protein WBJ62_09855 [Coriobacteriia bacterium]
MSQIGLLTEAVRALESAGVRYLLSGSLASSLQGEPRATHDIDLVVEVDSRLLSVLAEAFGADPYFFDPRAARDALGRRGMFNLLDTAGGDKIDFWMLTDDPFDASRFARRISVEAFDLSLWVSTPRTPFCRSFDGLQPAEGASGRCVTPWACTRCSTGNSMRPTSTRGPTGSASPSC